MLMKYYGQMNSRYPVSSVREDEPLVCVFRRATRVPIAQIYVIRLAIMSQFPAWILAA